MRGGSLPNIFGAAFPPPSTDWRGIRVAKRTHVPLGRAKFDVNRCNESPLQGENADFWPVSKFNTGSFPLRGILPVTNKHHIFAPTAGVRSSISKHGPRAHSRKW